MTRPSDKRNFTLALGVLAGMIWLIKSGKQISHQTFFHHLYYLEKYHMGAAHMTIQRGSRCLVLLACHGQNKWWDNDGSGHSEFQNLMQGAPIHIPNGLSKWHLCHWNVHHLTNQAHISLHDECSRKPIPFSPSKRLHEGWFDSRVPLGGEGSSRHHTNFSLPTVLSKSGQSDLFSLQCHQQGQEWGKKGRQ